jgi:hypothetical protein
MATKTRVANKTKWAFEDIIVDTKMALECYEWLNKNYGRSNDANLLRVLLALQTALAGIRFTATHGIAGEYHNDDRSNSNGAIP